MVVVFDGSNDRKLLEEQPEPEAPEAGDIAPVEPKETRSCCHEGGPFFPRPTQKPSKLKAQTLDEVALLMRTLVARSELRL